MEKITLTRNAKDEDPGYTFTDSKGRVWKINRLFVGDAPAGWDLVIPDGFGDRGGDVCGCSILREVRVYLANFLDVEAVKDKEQNRIQSTRNMAESVTRDLHQYVAEGAKARQAFIDTLTFPGSLCYHTGWSKSLVADYLSKLATITLESAEKIGLAKAVNHHVEYYTDEMLRNHYREGSASAMSNAVDGMKRQVVSDYISKLKDWSRYLDIAADLDTE